MLFNSHEFLFIFLPASFILFWYGGWGLSTVRWRLALLTAASYVFYSVWQFGSIEDCLGTLQITSWSALARSAWRWRFTLIMLLSSSVDFWAARWIVWTPKGRLCAAGFCWHYRFQSTWDSSPSSSTLGFSHRSPTTCAELSRGRASLCSR